MEGRIWFSTCSLVYLALACYADTLTATCTMTGVSADSTEKITGTINFRQPKSSNTVTIKVDLTGFDATDVNTKHGFHIHQTGSTGNNCADAGGHFGSSLNNHGGPGAAVRHYGDLGNVNEVSGAVSTTLTDSTISLKPSSLTYTIGKAVVVHQKEDDLGLGTGDSLSTGNAGARIGCCVIQAGAQGVTFNLTLMFLCFMGLLAFSRG